MPHPQNTPADFHAKVRRTEPATCWPFQGAILDSGYGTFKLAGVTWRAHRLAYVLANGPIPEGLAVLHACDNRPCCNPAHLFLGTAADNQADMTAKGRGRVGNRNGSRTKPEALRRGATWPKYAKPETIARGEQIGIAKLTEDSVRAVRLLIADGLGDSTIARRFNVTHGTIWCIRVNRTWKHVPS